jgi:hypothetical protein
MVLLTLLDKIAGMGGLAGLVNSGTRKGGKTGL